MLASNEGVGPACELALKSSSPGVPIDGDSHASYATIHERGSIDPYIETKRTRNRKNTNPTHTKRLDLFELERTTVTQGTD